MRKRDEVVTLSTIIDEVKISNSVPNGREKMDRVKRGDTKRDGYIRNEWRNKR